MNKVWIGFVLLVLGLISCSTGNQTAPSMPSSTPEPVPVMISLKQVVDAFKAAGLPMHKEVVYDERTDPNGLLGRPGRYVEKMNFTDTRIKEKFKPLNKEMEQMNLNCSIEIFKERADAENRHQYLEAIGKSSGMFDSYKFLHKNVLVRIALKLIPSEADEYKRVLESL